MRAAFLYFLVRAWTADRYRQAQREAPARAASRAHHTRTPRRGHRVRGLPAVVTPLAYRAGRRQRMTEPITAQPHPPGTGVAVRPGRRRPRWPACRRCDVSDDSREGRPCPCIRAARAPLYSLRASPAGAGKVPMTGDRHE